MVAVVNYTIKANSYMRKQVLNSCIDNYAWKDFFEDALELLEMLDTVIRSLTYTRD